MLEPFHKDFLSKNISNSRLIMNIPPQYVFLYKGKWTPPLDTLMLSTIISSRDDARWQGNDIPPSVVDAYGRALKHEFGIDFSSTELSNRPQVLHSRYYTFKEVTRTSGVYWAGEYNFVSADDSVWSEIIKVMSHTYIVMHISPIVCSIT